MELYEELLDTFPKSSKYLIDNIWPNREQFMKAWTRNYVTLGGMTTGRGEMMNKVIYYIIIDIRTCIDYCFDEIANQIWPINGTYISIRII